MTDAPRRPLAKLESKDERISFRIQPSLRSKLQLAAIENGEELSRYVRDCVIRGHMLRESQKLYKATLG